MSAPIPRRKQRQIQDEQLARHMPSGYASGGFIPGTGPKATPTPIDPADIRPGDVVERREVLTVRRMDPEFIDMTNGYAVDRAADEMEGNVTWYLVHRPDPDAEAVEALAETFPLARSAPSDQDREGAREMIARLRDQGWDVVRRAES